jgi:hypothetical protein
MFRMGEFKQSKNTVCGDITTLHVNNYIKNLLYSHLFLYCDMMPECQNSEVRTDVHC